MPVVSGVPLSLSLGEVLRREGLRGYSRPEIKELVLELLNYLKSLSLLETAIAYEIYPVVQVTPEQLPLGNGLVIKGSLPPSLLPEVRQLAVAVCTIGPGLENKVAEYFNCGEPLRGLLLDGIGSAAVDALVREVCRLVADEASSHGYQSSSPLYPGMPGLPLREQQPLLEMVPAREIGVSLTPSGMMIPRKSTSMIIGLGYRMATWTQREACARCHLSQDCPYRVEELSGVENERFILD